MCKKLWVKERRGHIFGTIQNYRDQVGNAGFYAVFLTGTSCRLAGRISNVGGLGRYEYNTTCMQLATQWLENFSFAKSFILFSWETSWSFLQGNSLTQIQYLLRKIRVYAISVYQALFSSFQHKGCTTKEIQPENQPNWQITRLKSTCKPDLKSRVYCRHTP